MLLSPFYKNSINAQNEMIASDKHMIQLDTIVSPEHGHS